MLKLLSIEDAPELPENVENEDFEILLDGDKIIGCLHKDVASRFLGHIEGGESVLEFSNDITLRAGDCIAILGPKAAEVDGQLKSIKVGIVPGSPFQILDKNKNWVVLNTGVSPDYANSLVCNLNQVNWMKVKPSYYNAYWGNEGNKKTIREIKDIIKSNIIQKMIEGGDDDMSLAEL